MFKECGFSQGEPDNVGRAPERKDEDCNWLGTLFKWGEAEEEESEEVKINSSSVRYCGRYQVPIYSKPSKAPSRYINSLKQCGVYPEGATEWEFPERTFANERKSLEVHLSRFRPSIPPSAEAIANAVAGLLADYPRAPPSQFVSGLANGSIPNDEFVYCLLDFICHRRIKGDADPGHPWRAINKHKSGIYLEHRELLFNACTQRLRALCAWDCRSDQPSAEELVHRGLVDPVRLFIKNDPHKKSKIDSSFLRLISNVSFLDELVDRLLFGPQNEIEIDNWLDCPSKPGIGFTDEMMKDFSTRVFAHPRGKAEGDLSSWDWTVQGWELMVEAEMRIQLASLDPESLAAKVIRNRIYCVSLSVFVLSDGSMYAQTIPGIMLSGWYNTSSSNSRIVRLLCKMLGADWSVHMGDDFISDDVPGFSSGMTNFGHILKVFRPFEDEFEFCSTTFPSMIPSSKWKMFVKLLSNGTKVWTERLALYWDWMYQMRHHPDREILISLIEASGFLDENLGSH